MFKTSLFSGATTFFLKRLINQRRPHKGDRNSFPSGHTTTAFAFSTVVALEHPEWAIPAYALSTFVGLSRMNDNAHYLHDVTMGATIGMAYGYAFYHDESLLSYSVYPFGDGLVLGHFKRF
jgi:membrane-associated phospholipid phosphatase